MGWWRDPLESECRVEFSLKLLGARLHLRMFVKLLCVPAGAPGSVCFSCGKETRGVQPSLAFRGIFFRVAEEGKLIAPMWQDNRLGLRGCSPRGVASSDIFDSS